jgi:hypothetical protein
MEPTQLELEVPTYNGKWIDNPVFPVPDFGPPAVPVLVRRADGVRVVLGSHDYDDDSKPDIQIERRHNGWMIFLHPVGGSDASGFVVFLDDGRSFVAKEQGATDPVKFVKYEDAIAEIDDGPTESSYPHRTRVGPAIIPRDVASLATSAAVVEAFKMAQEALGGDSNDDEHDALLALVEALEETQKDSADTFVHVHRTGRTETG